eukprot:3179827-Amphidinium_carterae.1
MHRFKRYWLSLRLLHSWVASHSRFVLAPRQRPQFVYKNGATYTGEWKGSQRHGHGVQVHAQNGTRRRFCSAVHLSRQVLATFSDMMKHSIYSERHVHVQRTIGTSEWQQAA